MLTKSVLNKAADLISIFGLAKGILEDEKHQLCAIGAINVAMTGDVDSFSFYPSDYDHGASATPRIPAFDDAIHQGLSRRGRRLRAHPMAEIIDYNNDPKTTKNDMIDFLREIA